MLDYGASHQTAPLCQSQCGVGNCSSTANGENPLTENGFRSSTPPPKNPSVISAASAEDIDIAVEAARKAFFRNGGKDWSSATGAHQAKYLRAIAAEITERKPELAKLESLDPAKPLEEAASDMDDVAGCFEYYADIAEALDSKQKSPI